MPTGKRFYGAVTVGERGQIVIPVAARRDFQIEAGDKLLVLGDPEQGLTLAKPEALIDGLTELLSALQTPEEKDEE